MRSTGRRYLVLQLPGVAVAGVAVLLLWAAAIISGRVALAAWGAWLLKDLALYPFTKSAYEPAEASGADRLIGESAIAATRIAPLGQVRIRGELWSARLQDGGSVDPGCRVMVLGTDGLILVVSGDSENRPRQV